MHVTILVPGFGLASTFIGAYEVFANAGVLWNTLNGEPPTPTFTVCTASEDGRPVHFAGGITVTPDKSVDQVRKTDLVFVPAISLDLPAVFAKNPKMLQFLARQSRKGTIVAGVCTGVAMLAEAGLLDGRAATTHWALADVYRKRYPLVDWKPELFIIESKNLVCGGGVYASLDVSLHLVERFAGYEVAKQCSRTLLIDPPRTWQASFSAPLASQRHGDEKIQRAQDFLQEYFNKPLSVEDLAKHIGMSPRNFTRRFKQATGETPLAYLHQLRTNCAKRLLETDFKSVQEICYDVGYDDIPFFRSIFKRHTGLSPTDYRSRFGGQRDMKRPVQGAGRTALYN